MTLSRVTLAMIEAAAMLAELASPRTMGSDGNLRSGGAAFREWLRRIQSTAHQGCDVGHSRRRAYNAVEPLADAAPPRPWGRNLLLVGDQAVDGQHASNLREVYRLLYQRGCTRLWYSRARA
jgi:hypothetical protein